MKQASNSIDPEELIKYNSKTKISKLRESIDAVLKYKVDFI